MASKTRRNKMVRNYILALVSALLTGVNAPPVFAEDPATITIPERMPFAAGTRVTDEVRTECDLEHKLAGYVKSYLEQTHYNIKVTHDDLAQLDDKHLAVQIIGVHAAGPGTGSWETGGGSVVTIKAELKEGGKTIDTFSYYRKSVSGFGTCGPLANCVKTLGKDITRWLVKINPPPRKETSE
jgi:hypothetical protein